MKHISRRQFLLSSGVAIIAAPALEVLRPLGYAFARKTAPPDISGKIFRGDAPGKLWKFSHEAYFYRKLDDDNVVCDLCPNSCVLSPGDRSVCRSRVNMAGTLYSLTYGNPCAVHVDPIEKKPLYHFKPQSTAFSIATTGCNLRCLNCQNWEISQVKPEDVRYQELFPAEALSYARNAGATSIAYTYSEPTTFFEYMLDTARLARVQGISNVWITNGYINRKPLVELCNVLDAANVNLKSFSDDVYRRLNGGRLDPVLQTFKTLKQHKVHFEVTNLVVPGYTDDADMVRHMCDWILTNLGRDYPLHFLRFFPRYKLDRLPSTPVSILERFRAIAIKQGIRYVYLGNVPGHEGNNTYCHNCGKLIIERKGYFMPSYNLNGNRCQFCKAVIPGVWEETSPVSL